MTECNKFKDDLYMPCNACSNYLGMNNRSHLQYMAGLH